jgi:hypothetical protein
MTEDKKMFKKEYDVRYTDNIAEAEKWQNEGFKACHVSSGKIWMRRKVEDGLFIEKMQNDKAFREKVLREGGYKTSNLYK